MNGKDIRDVNPKNKVIEAAIGQIEKQYGKGSIMKLGEKKAVEQVQVISSGNIQIDDILGIGGFPRGRVVEIYGSESSGKTTLALHAIAEAQKMSGVAAFIDAEHALDAAYAKALGVQVEDLLISQPDTGEQALEIAEILVRSGAVDIIVIDSVAALVPRAEIEGEMGDSHMGLQARLMSQALRKLTSAISKSNTCVIFINQLRMKIGVMFGNPETTTGGVALKFYASIRMEIRKTNTIKKGEEIIGNTVKVKVVKNKLAAPFKEAEIEIYYGEGISNYSSVVDLGVKYGIIDKSGTWFSYGDLKLGQGKANVIAFLKENQNYYEEIEKKIRIAMGNMKIQEESEEEK